MASFNRQHSRSRSQNNRNYSNSRRNAIENKTPLELQLEIKNAIINADDRLNSSIENCSDVFLSLQNVEIIEYFKNAMWTNFVLQFAIEPLQNMRNHKLFDLYNNSITTLQNNIDSRFPKHMHLTIKNYIIEKQILHPLIFNLIKQLHNIIKKNVFLSHLQNENQQRIRLFDFFGDDFDDVLKSCSDEFHKRLINDNKSRIQRMLGFVQDLGYAPPETTDTTEPLAAAAAPDATFLNHS